jgi:bacterioferritin
VVRPPPGNDSAPPARAEVWLRRSDDNIEKVVHDHNAVFVPYVPRPRHGSGVTLRIQEEAMPSQHDKIDRDRVVLTLNTILELELAGVVRYVHYSLMVFGHARIPIIGWMRNQAIEGMNHASIAGEHVTSLGGHPSLKIGQLIESHKHEIGQILHEALEHERATLRTYYELLDLVRDKSVWLEEYAREQIKLEEQHIAEVEKMMRKPGELTPRPERP